MSMFLFSTASRKLPSRGFIPALSHHRFLSASAASSTVNYDVVVIGSDPAATQCALESSRRGKRVALVDQNKRFKGGQVYTGTIGTRTFREAVVYLTGYLHTGFYGKAYTVKRKVGIPDILDRVEQVAFKEVDSLKKQLKSNQIDLIYGEASFRDEHHLEINPSSGGDEDQDQDEEKKVLKAEKFLISCGAHPAKHPMFPCDGKLLYNSNQIVSKALKTIPRDLIVVGAGKIGMEFASMINVLPGTRVTVIDEKEEVLAFADRDIVGDVIYQMRQNGARFMLGEQIESIEQVSPKCARVSLASGKVVEGDALLFTPGKHASTEGLNLEGIGIETGNRGMIKVNDVYQTTIPNIYAAGDCIGPPSLDSTSMEQGRLVSCNMWGGQDEVSQLKSGNYPIGVYTIPEMSMVGKTETELKNAGQNYEVGLAKFEEVAKGCMTGQQDGWLKIIFDPDTLQVLGVQAIGESALEIIHIGQVSIAMGCTLTYFRDAVFNYPTFAEAYRVAALNGLGRI